MVDPTKTQLATSSAATARQRACRGSHLSNKKPRLREVFIVQMVDPTKTYVATYAPFRKRNAPAMGPHLSNKKPRLREVFIVQNGGPDKDRTCDLLHAMQALSQLSYGPVYVYSIAIF